MTQQTKNTLGSTSQTWRLHPNKHFIHLPSMASIALGHYAVYVW